MLAAVFGLAFLTGSRFGPDVTPAPATAVMAGHDRASDGAVHRAELVLDVA